MKRSHLEKACAGIVSLALVLALLPATAFADSSSTIVTLGADLTDEQQQTVLEFFGLTEDDLESMETITVTNADEREYLEGTVSDSIIGTRTLSCSYIQLADSGGIEVETANLTYVTKNTIYNALQTAGIENCTVVVTAPFDVSGTGALTGIFLAVEADGTQLDEDKKEAATEELVATAELEDTYGSDVAEVISEVKDEVTSSADELSGDEIAELVQDAAGDRDISLSDDDLATITDLIETIQDLDYDVSAFSDTLGGATGFIASIKALFSSIVDFFKSLFGASSSIIDGLDTDVYELDDTEAGTDTDSASSTEGTDDGADTTADDETQADDVDATADETAQDESSADTDADTATDEEADASASSEDANATAESADDAELG